MNREKSCGAVVFTRTGGGIRYLIIRSKGGVHGFPKGHVERDETERETALREIREEVGLRVRLFDGFRTEVERPLPKKPGVIKTIVYFVAEYAGQEIRTQPTELSGAELLSYEEAMAVLEFDTAKRVLNEANAFLIAHTSAL